MIGLLCVEETKGYVPHRTLFTEQTIAGGRFCNVRIRLPAKGTFVRRCRIVQRAARRLHARGIRQVVLPPGPFAYGDVLRDCRLQSVPVLPFLYHFAADIALFWMETEGRAQKREGVVLQAGRMQVELARTAETLCRKVRNVAIQVPGGEKLQERLRMQYGLPALSGAAGYFRAGLVLLFSPMPGGATAVPGRGAVFSFCRPGALLQTKRKKLENVVFRFRRGAPIPGQWDQTMLLSALWEMGCLSLTEVEIEQLA